MKFIFGNKFMAKVYFYKNMKFENEGLIEGLNVITRWP